MTPYENNHGSVRSLDAERDAWPRVIWRTRASRRVVARRRTTIVILESSEVWAFEAKDRLCFVHCARGRFDVDLSLLQVEQAIGTGFLRVHRRWLANVTNIRELSGGSRRCGLWIADSAGHGGAGIRIPIAREAVRSVRETLLEGTVGLRHRMDRPSP